MMREEFRRSELLLGPQALERLAGAHAAVFGVGGVGRGSGPRGRGKPYAVRQRHGGALQHQPADRSHPRYPGAI